MNNTSKTSLLVLLVAGFLALTGCNTAHGFGKDVEKTGEKIQEKTK
jgi:entericidin A